MKKLINSLFIASFALILFSCGKDYDSDPEFDKSLIRNNLQGEFTAQVNGEPFEAVIKEFFDESVEGIRMLSISGIEFSEDKDPNKQKMITFTIPYYEGPKTYMPDSYFTGLYMDQDSILTKNYVTSLANDTLSHITVLQDGDRYEGSFYLMVIEETTKDILHLSAGHFNIPK